MVEHLPDTGGARGDLGKARRHAGQPLRLLRRPHAQEPTRDRAFPPTQPLPAGHLDWPNLFGSCKRAGTCGDHKDKCGDYPHQDLIKPDVEDPEAFLVFTPKGAIRPRANLPPHDQQRAKETIRILGLDGALNQIRRSEVAGYIQTAEAFAEMAATFSENEWLPLLQEEIQNTAHLPFATAIRHVLTRQSETA